jgi:hypothetical protein
MAALPAQPAAAVSLILSMVAIFMVLPASKPEKQCRRDGLAQPYQK